MDSCRSCSDNLEIIEGVSVEDFEILEQQQQQQQQRQQQQPSQEEEEEQNHSCKVDLSNGETIYCDLLIAADGIHSNIRKKIHPFVQTEHMGYTYFRANVSVQDLSPDFDWHAKSFEIWGGFFFIFIIFFIIFFKMIFLNWLFQFFHIQIN